MYVCKYIIYIYCFVAMHAPLQLIKIDFQALADALEDPESDPNCKVGGVKTEGVLEGNNWSLRICLKSLNDIHVQYI